jgi:hypothetical protein
MLSVGTLIGAALPVPESNPPSASNRPKRQWMHPLSSSLFPLQPPFFLTTPAPKYSSLLSRFLLFKPFHSFHYREFDIICFFFFYISASPVVDDRWARHSFSLYLPFIISPTLPRVPSTLSGLTLPFNPLVQPTILRSFSLNLPTSTVTRPAVPWKSALPWKSITKLTGKLTDGEPGHRT